MHDQSNRRNSEYGCPEIFVRILYGIDFCLNFGLSFFFFLGPSVSRLTLGSFVDQAD